MRAMIEEDDFRETGNDRREQARIAPNFRAYGRPPTIAEAALYRNTNAANEERSSDGSLQCSRITIGVGQFSRLGRKKRERFLSIELGLAALVEAAELEEAFQLVDADELLDDEDTEDKGVGDDDGEAWVPLMEPEDDSDDWDMN